MTLGAIGLEPSSGGGEGWKAMLRDRDPGLGEGGSQGWNWGRDPGLEAGTSCWWTGTPGWGGELGVGLGAGTPARGGGKGFSAGIQNSRVGNPLQTDQYPGIERRTARFLHPGLGVGIYCLSTGVCPSW